MVGCGARLPHTLERNREGKIKSQEKSKGGKLEICKMIRIEVTKKRKGLGKEKTLVYPDAINAVKKKPKTRKICHTNLIML